MSEHKNHKYLSKHTSKSGKTVYVYPNSTKISNRKQGINLKTAFQALKIAGRNIIRSKTRGVDKPSTIASRNFEKFTDIGKQYLDNRKLPDVEIRSSKSFR